MAGRRPRRRQHRAGRARPADPVAAAARRRRSPPTPTSTTASSRPTPAPSTTPPIDDALRLITDAADAQPADRAVLADLNAAVSAYTNAVAQARDYNRQQLPIGIAYLNKAGTTLRADAPCRSCRPWSTPTPSGPRTRCTASTRSGCSGSASLALLVLFWVNRQVAQRFHRRFNVGLSWPPRWSSRSSRWSTAGARRGQEQRRRRDPRRRLHDRGRRGHRPHRRQRRQGLREPRAGQPRRGPDASTSRSTTPSPRSWSTRPPTASSPTCGRPTSSATPRCATPTTTAGGTPPSRPATEHRGRLAARGPRRRRRQRPPSRSRPRAAEAGDGFGEGGAIAVGLAVLTLLAAVVAAAAASPAASTSDGGSTHEAPSRGHRRRARPARRVRGLRRHRRPGARGRSGRAGRARHDRAVRQRRHRRSAPTVPRATSSAGSAVRGIVDRGRLVAGVAADTLPARRPQRRHRPHRGLRHRHGLRHRRRDLPRERPRGARRRQPGRAQGDHRRAAHPVPAGRHHRHRRAQHDGQLHPLAADRVLRRSTSTPARRSSSASTPASTSIEDLAGKRHLRAGRHHQHRQHPARSSPRPIPVTSTDNSACMVLFQNGEADGVSTDDTVLAGLAAQDPYAEVLDDRLPDPGALRHRRQQGQRRPGAPGQRGPRGHARATVAGRSPTTRGSSPAPGDGQQPEPVYGR